MEDKEYISADEKYELQRQRNINTNTPMFAPKYCYNCGQSVFAKISKEEAETSLVTGCPYCHKSFID